MIKNIYLFKKIIVFSFIMLIVFSFSISLTAAKTGDIKCPTDEVCIDNQIGRAHV